ncbi:GntR family transcriptional regulator [Paenibacillus mendelii]|uniref:GntR family transcriptional regulator n=1 Tax=Paenibacillus mendelii TaxID=206163 RepID=A0ABV6JQ25_9BACL|nr:GntR family transcriptional regulator [Paenibacillus mendelii]MCQ6562345.1 GntR family transcriptional regulator [Paenibacillus mendelii]
MSSFMFNPQSNISLREKVIHDIRSAILRGHIKPGERLKESDIADQMGVSRGPVREAIRQLEREGLIISPPYRETVVVDLDADEIREFLIPIRYHLESTVIKKYMHLMDEPFFDRLQGIVDEMGKPLRSPEIYPLVELDLSFHESIIHLAAERTVQTMWQSISHHIKLHFNKNTEDYDRENFVQDHALLLSTLRTKDLGRIQQDLLAHMNLF